jgi:hypothetical protein
MCIAIYKPAGKIISKANLAQCFKANPDGAGFMYAKDKELNLLKGFFTFDEFWDVYEPLQNEQCLIHFRIKTHGEINYTNCHPFLVNKSLGFIHNGVISGFGAGKLSDTVEFNEQIIKPLVNKYGNRIMFDESIVSLIESRIGYSKLAFLDRHGNFNLFNENKGVWDNEVWYSNTSYKIPEPKPALPFKQPSYTFKAKPKHRTVQEDDLVELLTGVYDSFSKTYFKAHTVMQVVTVNSDYTCDLMQAVPDKDGVYNFAYDVSFAKFDFLSDLGDPTFEEQPYNYNLVTY